MTLTGPQDRWLLPDGVEECLPPRAARIEQLRRRLLDGFFTWGYEQIVPPFVEYVESLLVGSAEDLELQTFKLIDQLNGRLLGVRPDITPQAARIDAHRLRRQVPTRLCYVGTVLHARGSVSTGARSPMQIGAELFGHAGIESDVEIMCLMHESIRTAGLEQMVIDLGHVGIFHGLARQAGLGTADEQALFRLIQQKALPEIKPFLNGRDLPPSVRAMLVELAELNGPAEELGELRASLRGCDQDVRAALDDLERVVDSVGQRLSGPVELHVDLAELRGYRYQTGIVFAAFQPGIGREIARGGRYDEIGKVFGRARPATGFSGDLLLLADIGAGTSELARGVFAPWDHDPGLAALIAELRAAGERVVVALPGQVGSAQEMGCDRLIINQRDGGWQVVPA